MRQRLGQVSLQADPAALQVLEAFRPLDLMAQPEATDTAAVSIARPLPVGAFGLVFVTQ